MEPKPRHTLSPRRIIRSFGYALEGVFYLLKNEKNFQIHILAILVVTGLGFYCQLAAWEWCVVILCFMIIVLGEALNSALEKLCDFVAPEKQALIKIAKDVAAAGVLLAAFGSAIIALIIFGGRIF